MGGERSENRGFRIQLKTKKGVARERVSYEILKKNTVQRFEIEFSKNHCITYYFLFI